MENSKAQLLYSQARYYLKLKDYPTLFKVVFHTEIVLSKDSARSTGHAGHFFPKILPSLQEINA